MSIRDFPFLLAAICFIALWLAANAGTYLHRKRQLPDAEHEDLSVILNATLALLGLIIAFTFSMATNRYDLRKTCEEAEANAVGTEYLRAELMPVSDATRVRDLLRSYLDQRILFYTVRDPGRIEKITAFTAQLQKHLWSAVKAPASANSTPIAALVVSGMNDVLNAQGFTQAAWWNRIPTPAWILLVMLGICSNVLLGYNALRLGGKDVRLCVLPLILSIAFLLIADLDSPRGGAIWVSAPNLTSVARALHAEGAQGGPIFASGATATAPR